MAIPKTQKAIIVHEAGGPEVIKYEDVPVPSLTATQVLVKNSYGGLNFVDSYFRKGGIYPLPFPQILGRESAGEVVAVGEKVSNFKVGDKVGYLIVLGGSFAEYTAVDSDQLIVKLPEDISEKDWAITALQLITAETLIGEAYPLKKGDVALVHAPVGGVGQYLVAIAKLIGATVIGSTSSAEKAERAKELGADYVIDYKKEDIAERVKEITKGKGVNVSYDAVGAATFDASINSLRKNGSLVSYGGASGPVPPIDLAKLPPKNIKVVRASIFTYVDDAEGWKFYTDALFKRLREKKLKLIVYKEYPLSDYAQATTDLESGKTYGKLLLKI